MTMQQLGAIRMENPELYDFMELAYLEKLRRVREASKQ
jgi:hypothetical protein